MKVANKSKVVASKINFHDSYVMKSIYMSVESLLDGLGFVFTDDRWTNDEDSSYVKPTIKKTSRFMYFSLFFNDPELKDKMLKSISRALDKNRAKIVKGAEKDLSLFYIRSRIGVKYQGHFIYPYNDQISLYLTELED